MSSPERPARFLFLHSETGEGHRRVALAVAETLEARYGARVRVELLDALTACALWPFCRLPDWYGQMLWAGGWPYGLGFRLLDGRRRARSLSRLCWPLVYPAVRRLLTEHPADVIVAFHPLPIHTVSQTLTEMDAHTPLVAVGTDLAVAHAFWADSAIQRYLLATEAARAQLALHGVDPARVEVVGLPVGRPFVEAARENPRELRNRLGLDTERPVVLVMGGGVGFEPLARVARAVASAGLPAQLVILTGRNDRLHTQLTSISWPARVHVVGFVDGAHEWMRAADLLVTKAGPATLAEALALGIPLVLWGAIPAQETPNARLVAEAGAGVWAPRPARAAKEVARLLDDPNARARMREKARCLARPEASERVASALWETALSAKEASPTPTRSSARDPDRHRPG